MFSRAARKRCMSYHRIYKRIWNINDGADTCRGETPSPSATYAPPQDNRSSWREALAVIVCLLCFLLLMLAALAYILTVVLKVRPMGKHKLFCVFGSYEVKNYSYVFIDGLCDYAFITFFARDDDSFHLYSALAIRKLLDVSMFAKTTSFGIHVALRWFNVDGLIPLTHINVDEFIAGYPHCWISGGAPYRLAPKTKNSNVLGMYCDSLNPYENPTVDATQNVVVGTSKSVTAKDALSTLESQFTINSKYCDINKMFGRLDLGLALFDLECEDWTLECPAPTAGISGTRRFRNVSQPYTQAGEHGSRPTRARNCSTPCASRAVYT
ncbi:hypothetical protein MTO96_009436 [Rhipicephalus appendiculatus]